MSRHLPRIFAAACVLAPISAHAQSSDPPPGYQQQQPPPGYQQPPPGYQQQQPPPGYQQPPPGYQQPPPAYQQPPPAYQQPPPPGNYPPPQYGPPPVYEPAPPPPPPKRTELQWSIRLNPLDLVLSQRFNVEVEYAFWGPLSIEIAPQYIFGDFRANNVVMTDANLVDHPINMTASGGGVYTQLGLWVEGRPLRGFFLKGHAEYNRITFRSDIDNVSIPQSRFGMLFGSQSIYGGWFTLSGGIGVVYDTSAKQTPIQFQNPVNNSMQTYLIPGSGRLSNGWDIIAQLAIGGSF
jgi:hypothetical protein